MNIEERVTEFLKRMYNITLRKEDFTKLIEDLKDRSISSDKMVDRVRKLLDKYYVQSFSFIVALTLVFNVGAGVAKRIEQSGYSQVRVEQGCGGALRVGAEGFFADLNGALHYSPTADINSTTTVPAARYYTQFNNIINGMDSFQSYEEAVALPMADAGTEEAYSISEFLISKGISEENAKCDQCFMAYCYIINNMGKMGITPNEVRDTINAYCIAVGIDGGWDSVKESVGKSDIEEAMPLLFEGAINDIRSALVNSRIRG